MFVQAKVFGGSGYLRKLNDFLAGLPPENVISVQYQHSGATGAGMAIFHSRVMVVYKTNELENNNAS